MNYFSFFLIMFMLFYVLVYGILEQCFSHHVFGQPKSRHFAWKTTMGSVFFGGGGGSSSIYYDTHNFIWFSENTHITHWKDMCIIQNSSVCMALTMLQ